MPAVARRPLDAILDQLQHFEQRATYGAVADVIGGIAQGVMQGRPKTPRHSWVVSKATGLPTGYREHEVAPTLRRRSQVIATGRELRAWLAAPR